MLDNDNLLVKNIKILINSFFNVKIKLILQVRIFEKKKNYLRNKYISLLFIEAMIFYMHIPKYCISIVLKFLGLLNNKFFIRNKKFYRSINVFLYLLKNLKLLLLKS